MSQPLWRQDLTDGDRVLFVDVTGQKCAEVEVTTVRRAGGVRIYRFPIPRLDYTDGGLLIPRARYAQECPADYEEWFSRDLEKVADYVGSSKEDLALALCSKDVPTRFEAYLALVDYHGPLCFDHYPKEIP